MSGQMLLINPAKRRKARSTAKRRKSPSAAQKANWARFAKMARSKSAARSNPIRRKRASVKRRRNPITIRSRAVRNNPVRRRQRNPIALRGMGGSLFNFRSYIAPLKDAAVMGAGAVAMDIGFGYVNRYLPASMQQTPGQLGVGDAVKAVLTVALGKLLSKATRGLSTKAAMGSLVVQFRDITMQVMPASMMPAMNGVGFVSPGYVVPQRRMANSYTRPGASSSVGMITQGQKTPSLSMMQMGTTSPLLSSSRNRLPVRR